MKKTAIILVLFALAIPFSAFADDGAALFKAKCAACHGPDGAKLAKANLGGAAVQARSDADLVTFIGTNAKHNFKTKGLSDEQIKSLVTFIRTLKK